MDDTDYRSLEPTVAPDPAPDIPPVGEDAVGEVALDVAALLAECDALAG